MMQWFVDKLHNASTELQIDFNIVLYGLKVEIAFWLETLIILFLCACLHKLQEGVVFICSFTFLRSYCGGYHCKTLIQCGLVTIFMVILSCLAEKYVSNLHYCWITIPFMYLFVVSPVQNENQILNAKEIGLYSIYAKIRLTLLLVLYLFLQIIRSQIPKGMILMAMAWLMVLCMFQKYRIRKGVLKNECIISNSSENLR